MKIKNRVIEFANIILSEKLTVREVAKKTGYSKSTVHNDLAQKLINIDKVLYKEVSKLLEYNKKIKHLRGGMSTKVRYSK